MQKVTIALGALVAVLLLVQIIDRSREPAQLKALAEASERAAQASERQTLELKALREELARRPAAAPAPVAVEATPAATRPAATAPVAGRDGKPRLGGNFLKPYDRSAFHPEWVGGTLRVFSETPKGFNPILENSSTSNDAHALVNDGLADKHPATPMEWSEGLATSCVISDDWKTYTFTLRPGVVWQRPTCAKQPEFAWLDRDVPMTARDFVFLVEMTKHPEVECPQLKAYFDDLDRAEAPDDLTLVLHWKKKVFTSMSASLGLRPLPRHIYAFQRDGAAIPSDQLGTAFNKHWFDEIGGIVGVGAFTLEESLPDKRMRFRRNPAYWGVGQHFAAIEWDAEVKQPDPQLVAFKNGQVHASGLTPTQYKSQILDRSEPRFAALDPKDPKAGRAGELGWERVRSHAYVYIGWNLRRPLLAERNTRIALAHAFPKQRVIDEVYFGLGRPQIGPVHLDSPYFDKALVDYAFDLDLARRRLAEAGWKDGDGDGWIDRTAADGSRQTLRFELKSFANAPVVDSMLAIYRDELKKIGVDLVVKTYEWKEMLRIYEEKDFDAVIGSWNLGSDLEEDFWQLWHSSHADEPRTSNHCGFRNKRVDELADRLRETFETDARRAIVHEVEGIIHAEQPYLFIRSAEGIFTWQNQQPPQADRTVLGVETGLDAYHPFFSRDRMVWHLARP